MSRQWPAPIYLRAAIAEAISAHNRAHPEAQFPAVAIRVVNDAITDCIKQQPDQEDAA